MINLRLTFAGLVLLSSLPGYSQVQHADEVMIDLKAKPSEQVPKCDVAYDEAGQVSDYLENSWVPEQKEMQKTEQKGLKSLWKKFHPYEPFVAASSATLVSSSMTYPLDLVKLRLQAASLAKGALYKGYVPYAFATCFYQSISYPVYEDLKSTGIAPLWAGMLSASIANLMSAPAWTYRTMTSLAQPQAPYSLSCFIRDVRSDPKVAYRGLGANMAGVVTQGMYFHLYEFLKHQWDQFSGDTPTQPVAHFGRDFISSGASRLMVMGVYYPIETLRVIKQSEGGTYCDIYRSLWRQGPARFYKGFPLAAVKGSVGAAISMAIFQKLKQGYEDTRLKGPSIKEQE